MYAGANLKNPIDKDIVYFAINAYWEKVRVELPEIPTNYHWKLYVNTGNPADNVIVENQNIILNDRRITMEGRSVIVAVAEKIW